MVKLDAYFCFCSFSTRSAAATQNTLAGVENKKRQTRRKIDILSTSEKVFSQSLVTNKASGHVQSYFHVIKANLISVTRKG